jgi:hypothetical protein
MACIHELRKQENVSEAVPKEVLSVQDEAVPLEVPQPLGSDASGRHLKDILAAFLDNYNISAGYHVMPLVIVSLFPELVVAALARSVSSFKYGHPESHVQMLVLP